jgi:hypothetical protein
MLVHPQLCVIWLSTIHSATSQLRDGHVLPVVSVTVTQVVGRGGGSVVMLGVVVGLVAGLVVGQERSVL